MHKELYYPLYLHRKNYSVPQQTMVDNQLYTCLYIFNINVTWKACVLYHTLFVKGRRSRGSRRVLLRLKRKKDTNNGIFGAQFFFNSAVDLLDLDTTVAKNELTSTT
jgi:hypothetical protein